jgi:transcriptional regulator with XRE-family HTH domain
MDKDTFLLHLGRHIASLREKKGFSQADLARSCDKDPQSLNRLKKGKIDPSIYYLYQIGTELGVPLGELTNIEIK